jgi:hypothetical protein
LVANEGCSATPIRPRSPAESTATVANGVASSAPFLTTRNEPPCSAMKRRPSGACANAVALVRPTTQLSSRVKPLGCVVVPPSWTSAVDQDETFPEVSVARARTTCWPLG